MKVTGPGFNGCARSPSGGGLSGGEVSGEVIGDAVADCAALSGTPVLDTAAPSVKVPEEETAEVGKPGVSKGR